MIASLEPALPEHRYALAAELFGVLSAPVRLKIVCALMNGERNVGQLLSCVDASQPNLSQHLALMYRSGVLARRREGAQVHYRLADDRARTLCQAALDDHSALTPPADMAGRNV